MTYERRVDRHNPGCLIFLVDQSESMSDPMSGVPVSKAVALADQLNSLLYELIQRCTKSLNEPPRPYFSIGVLGYHTDDRGAPIVGSLLQLPGADASLVTTTELALKPLRLDERQRTQGNAIQRYVVPVWVEPLASGGTPVCAAIDHAGRLVRDWVAAHRDSFPPIVINLSDGESTDGNPQEWAGRLSALATNDGATLFFNLDLSASGTSSTLFPSAPSPSWTRFSSGMFQMSSALPDSMLAVARAQGHEVRPGARGFGLNADFRAVVNFLNVGTSIGHFLR